MLINTIYEFIQFLKRQGHSQYFSPEEIIGGAFNRASIDLYIDEHRMFEKTSIVGDNLRNFKKNVVIDRDGNDLFPLPTGEETTPIPIYFNWTNISSLVTEGDPPVESEYRGKVYTDGEWLDSITSSLLPPEDKNIQARVIDGSLQVLPLTQSKIKLYYLTKPAEAVYAYDLVDNKITFNEVGSVDPDWPITAHNELIMRTMTYLGIAMTDQVLMMVENLTKQPANKPA